VIQASKSILLQCNKLNSGLIFSCFQAVRGCRPLPIVLVPKAQLPGARYDEQIPALWRFAPVEIADATAAGFWLLGSSAIRWGVSCLPIARPSSR
jgi:hypothetical protein